MPLVLDTLAPQPCPVQTIEDGMTKRINILEFIILALEFKSSLIF